MDHDKGAMTRVVDQLAERGLITRSRNDEDRRVSNLATTEAGHAVVVDLARRVTAIWNDILRDFDHDEVVRLIATLYKLLVRLDPSETEAEH
jgi:DNA-binding MarR family transcriptional regulator